MNPTTLLRRQFRTPLFALAVMLLVAAVVAINATAFGAIHALRWKALPYADADQLVELRGNMQKFGLMGGLNWYLLGRVAGDRAHFAGAAGFSGPNQPRSDAAGRDWRLAQVTPGFERVLGVAPQLGRAFADDDAHAGADTLLLSDRVWRERFAADPDVVGNAVRFADRSYRVIGVMPRGFAFPDATADAWTPYVATAFDRSQQGKGYVGGFEVVARLAAGTSVAQARAALAAIFSGEHAVLAEVTEATGLVADARPWRERFLADHWRALALLQLAALILLAVVTANLINLNLDRLLGRARELDIRRALGAGEGDIVRTVLADLAPPIVAGLVFGLALTPLGLNLLTHRGLIPEGLPQPASVDAATLVCGLAVAAIALGTVLVAALLSRGRARLSNRSSAGLGRARPVLLVAQIMLTTALLGSAGLLLRSAMNLAAADRGFDAHGVLLTALDPAGVTTRGTQYDPTADYRRWAPVVEHLRSEVATLPGVETVAVASAPPFSGSESVSTTHVSGRPETIRTRDYSVGPGYFAALGMRFVSGRDFNRGDEGDASPVVVDNTFAHRHLADVDPLGATIDLHIGNQRERKARIVGVVHAAKHAALDESAALPTVYRLDPAPLPVFWLVTRTRGDPAALAQMVRRRLHQRSPDTDIIVDKPLTALVAATLVDRRTLLQAIGGFAGLTLLLAGLGLAAVLSFSIRRRTSELGVRMALGATASRIVALVMRQGAMLILLGSALGLALGLPLARLLADRLYGVGFSDPATWSAAAILVIAVAAFACWLPARRAGATDPMVALRDE
ncbi:MAG TPA: ABC transporter permease [Rhodanobacteraceae bacterium]|nr:ABC transporter permease [Rhodanobacteraceae bacterium]